MCLTKYFIGKRMGRKVTNDEMEILNDLKGEEEKKGIYIKFSCVFNNQPFLNANAFFGNIIVLNPAWAARIIQFTIDKRKDSGDKQLDELKRALDITIGHELTHKERQMSWCRLSKKKRKFVAWVNEVHADFGGAERRAGGSRARLLESIRYKRALHPDGDDTTSHPSWEKREKYAQKGKFDDKLIRRIAGDVNYKNERFINKVCGRYREIELRD